MIEYVVVLPYTVDTPVIRLPLVEKLKPEYMAGMLNLAGGKIEEGESPEDAARRELWEESGLESVEEYDGMCPVETEYMGVIIGNVSKIHCVRVPISSKQELSPRIEEKEKIEWYVYPHLLDQKYLMPNLRVTIPLMLKGIKGWTILDKFNTWRTSNTHQVTLIFNDIANNPITVNVKAVGYFKHGEEE